MEFGFIDSPHFLAYVSYSPPSTRSKYRDELNQSYPLNRSHHTPISKKSNSVKESNNFMGFLFGTDQYQNKAEKETKSSYENSQSFWNNKTCSPVSHGNLMLYSSEDKFSPIMSSSPILDTSKIVKTSQDNGSSIAELQLFASNSNFQNTKNNNDNSVIFDKDTLNFLDQEFINNNLKNPENSSSEDDSQKNFNEESLKPLSSFYEIKEISQQLSVSEDLSQYLVPRQPYVREECIEVFGGESAGFPCTDLPFASNIDSCIFRRTEDNEVSCQVNANESNNASNNTLAFPNTTKNFTVKNDFNIEFPFPLNSQYRKHFFKNNFTILKTPERRCSISNVKSGDTFKIPNQKLSAGDDHNLELDMYNIDNFENIIKMQNISDSFELENAHRNMILEENVSFFRNNECDQQLESIVENKMAENFQIDACDSTYENKGIEFPSANASDVMPENICNTSTHVFDYRSDLKDSWFTDCGISASDQTIAVVNIRENLNVENDSRFNCESRRPHTINSTNVVSENVLEINYQSELRNLSNSNCSKSISEKSFTAPSIRENLSVETFSSNLCTTDQQIGTFSFINQLSEQMTSIQNIQSSGSKILPQIRIDSFMKETSLLSNEFSSHTFTQVKDCTLCTVGSLRTEQTSLQVVSYSSKALQASSASTLEFSSNLDFIGKRKDFNYLEHVTGNLDLTIEKNSEKYSLSERDAKSLTAPAKKCLTFPSISNNDAKEKEFTICKKKSSCNDTTLKSKIDENQESGSDIDFEDFVSVSEYCSSSSETFYDIEESYDSGSSEKGSSCSDNLKNFVTATPSSCFKNKYAFQDGSTNCSESQTSSATKSNSTSDLFNLNEPIIIKYLNEHTQQIQEMLIYPLEYYEKLSEKIGRKSTSRGKALEKLIEKSKYYVGKPVGIILDVKDITKKIKPVAEERISSVELPEEKNPEDDILAVEKSFNYSHVANAHCDKQIVRSHKERFSNSEDSRSSTISCFRKVRQSEGCKQLKNAQSEKNDTINTYYSKTSKYLPTSHTDRAFHLTENTNVYLNDQKTVVSSVCKYKSQKRYYLPSPVQLNSVSSKSNSYFSENTHKSWLHVDKQPQKSVINSQSTVNSRKPPNFIIHSNKQQEIKILRKTQSAENFTKCAVKPGLFKLKRNLTHLPSEFSPSRSVQKYDSFSSKPFNNSSEKCLQKMELASKKRYNIDEIISSDFKTYFNSYAKRGGRLKSGSVISKSNSNYWLKKAGLIYDEKSLKIAEESFEEVASIGARLASLLLWSDEDLAFLKIAPSSICFPCQGAYYKPDLYHPVCFGGDGPYCTLLSIKCCDRHMFLRQRRAKKILEKSEENDFGKCPKIANEIYELCRLLSEQRKSMDSPSSETASETSLISTPNIHQFSNQKIPKKSSPVTNGNLTNDFSLIPVSFDPQKHTDSSISSHSESLFENQYPCIKNNYSLLPFESNPTENERIQRYNEFGRHTLHEPLNHKSNSAPIVSNIKTIPSTSDYHNQFEEQLRNKLNHAERSQEVSSCNKINTMSNTVLKNDLNLHSEDIFSASEPSKGMQRTIFDSDKSHSGLNTLYHGSRFYVAKQKAPSFNSMNLCDIKFQKDNSLCRTVLHNADRLTKQYEEIKSIPEQVLNSVKTESKLISFNFSLHLENQRKQKEDDRNLFQKKASRGFSIPGNIGLISKSDNCVFVQAKLLARKCKSEGQIIHESKNTQAIKFLTNNIYKSADLDSNLNNLQKSITSEDASKLKRIPTLRGQKLPAKVSVLLLNGPILLNYTENIAGKSQEILICTKDTIEDIIRNENGIRHQDIMKKLLAKSRPYIGKPIHIIFDPKKATEFPSPVDSGEGIPVPLHPSSAKLNLLAEEPKVAITEARQTNVEKDPDRTSYSVWENSSEETLVEKQNDHLKEIENRIRNTDSRGLDSSAKQNKRLETSSGTRSFELQAKKKLKIRLCRRKKSRTALKRVNVKQIVNSVFRNFFHFYSVLGGHLKSGSVITKSNSILWLREAGIATDARSLEMANELFKNIAGAKVVLNIFDYMQFLNTFARKQRMATVDLIRQLTIYELPMASKRLHKHHSETRRQKTPHQSKRSGQGSTEIASMYRSQSLPNLKTALTALNS
ncbi:hypothetical protein HNY73_013976 [Argiope bruennichi]|uniref:Uncharacterized protein n=1 Tax=Argiope bruennichi TaxID=94029 RepID=A0A8T0ENV6_ARGBR|nr:hypothetical protein HNY73_013976 [Argiope bruennichi]